MKKIVSLLLALIISIGFLPVTALAVDPNDPEFEAYLNEIGWEKQEYIEYLENKDWSLEEYFWSVDELGIPLTEESIQAVLEEFDMTREELNALLVQFGDIYEGQDVLDGDFIIFEEELSDAVDYYLNLTPIDDNNLQELLDFYEFESKEALESYLNEYGESIEYYDYIEDLDLTIDLYLNETEWSGTPIDDTNLQDILESYEFESKEALEEFLNEYGDSIEYYEFIEDLDYSLNLYLYEYDDEELTVFDSEFTAIEDEVALIERNSVYVLFLLQLFYGLIFD